MSRDHDYFDSPVSVEQLSQACHRRTEELESRLEALNVLDWNGFHLTHK